MEHQDSTSRPSRAEAMRKKQAKVVRLFDEEPGAYTVPGTPVPVRLFLSLLLFPFSSSPPQARRSTMSSLFSVSAPHYIEFPLYGVKKLRIYGLYRQVKKQKFMKL